MHKLSRLLFIFPTLLLSVFLCFIPSTSRSSTGLPLEVSDFQVSLINVVRVQSATGMNMPSNGTMGMTMPGGAGGNATSENDRKLQFSLKAVNTIDKTVTAIEWEARFIDAKQNIISKKFKTKKKIKPSKDEKLEEGIEYDTRLLPSDLKVGFRIIKVEYSDNTNWENCTDNTDSCFVYKTLNFK